MPEIKSEDDFFALLEKHQNILHKICRIYTQTEEEHQDLFQEISIQLWQSYPRFKGKSKFTTWMYRVGINTAITLFRKQKRSIDTLSINENQVVRYQEEYDDEKDQQLEWLFKQINDFSKIDKALVLLYLDNKKYDEIAETLGISPGNARVKMNRIKQKLSKMLKTK